MASTYWPVLRHPVLRRLLPGLSVSALGDGMAILAVSWLALELAPVGHRGGWVAFAVAAYTLPSVGGTVVFGRLLGDRAGAQLAGWDAALRAAALGAIPVAYVCGVLSVGLYVGLLATSSLLHSWGSAGRYTLIAELLPERDRLAGNAVLSTIAEVAGIAGPPLAGLLIGWGSAVWVIAADAATFAVLALTYRSVRLTPAKPEKEGRKAGFSVLRQQPELLGLLTLSFGFFFLFGPVDVALPLYVADELHSSAALLGTFFLVFGVGAVAGGVLAGHLRRGPVTIGIVILFGLTLLPLGLGAPVGWSLVAFGVSGAVWAPYLPVAMALLQRRTTSGNRARVLAAYGAVTVVAVPVGTILGGPLVAGFGARGALLCCALGIAGFGLVAAVIRGAAQVLRSGRSRPMVRPITDGEPDI